MIERCEAVRSGGHIFADDEEKNIILTLFYKVLLDRDKEGSTTITTYSTLSVRFIIGAFQLFDE